jgi:hypothetical protein
MMCCIHFTVVADYDECLQSLTDLFRDPVNQEKAQQFLKIQGKLTLHRLAFAATGQNSEEENLKLEREIHKALAQITDQSSNPDFLAAKEMFERNPLSRTGLAKILRYTSEILNEQMGDNNEINRKYYHLRESDLKILAIISEKEIKNGDIQSILKGRDNRGNVDRTDDRTILNFTKVINSSMRERKGKDSKEIFSSKILSLTDQLNSIIESLDISDDCKESFALNCNSNDILPQAILEALQNASDLDKHNHLRYDSFWLHVNNKASANRTNSPTLSENNIPNNQRRDPNNQQPTRPRQRPPELTPPNPQSFEDVVIIEDHPQGEPEQRALPRRVDPPIPPVDEIDRTINEFLIDRVLGRYDYYFSREQLQGEPELVFAITRAIDEKTDIFSYQGKEYLLPEAYNKEKYLEDGIRDVFRASQYAVTASIAYTRKLNEIKSSPENLCQGTDRDLALITSRIGRLRENKRPKIFEYNNQFCDAKTGAVIVKSKEGFLGFSNNNETSTKNAYSEFKNLSENDRVEIIAQAELGRSTYVDEQNEARTFNGHKISETENSLEGSQNPNRLRAGHEDRETYLTSSTVFKNTQTNEPLLPTAIDELIVENLNQFSDRPNPALSSTIPTPFKRRWANAISNNDLLFSYADHVYSRYTGDILADGPGQIIVEDKKWVDDRELRALDNSLNELNAHDLVVGFHKIHQNQCDFYTVVDKKKNALIVYDNDGNILLNKEVLLGSNISDDRMVFYDEEYENGARNSNRITSAGIYKSGRTKTADDNKYYENYDGLLFTLHFEEGSFIGGGDVGHEAKIALHPIPPSIMDRYSLLNDGNDENNRVSGGCVNLTLLDLQEYTEKFGQSQCPFYILPEEEHNRFVIRDGKIAFEPVNRSEACNRTSAKNNCTNDSYYSPIRSYDEATPLKLIVGSNIVEQAATQKSSNQSFLSRIFDTIIKDPASNTATWAMDTEPDSDADKNLNEFTETLENRKNHIMEVTGLSNNEYNDLSKLAVAIMGVESGFCVDDRYKIKEGEFLKIEGQDLISMTKSISGRGGECNSRGCTQIKCIESIYKELGVDSDGNPVPVNERDNITFDENTLGDPSVSAEATMYYLALAMRHLKSHRNDLESDIRLVDSSAGLSNFEDYMYYVYNGANNKVLKGITTPDLSLKVRELRAVMENVYSFRGETLELVSRDSGQGIPNAPLRETVTEGNKTLYSYSKAHRDCQQVKEDMERFTGKVADTEAEERERILFAHAKASLGRTYSENCSEPNSKDKIIPFKRIVIHHTGQANASAMSAYYSGQNDVGDIAYNYVIGSLYRVSAEESRIYEGRNKNLYSLAHYQDGANADGLSIAVTGDFNVQELSQLQLEQLRNLIAQMIQENPSIKSIVGHTDLFVPPYKKDCPGKNLEKLIPSLNNYFFLSNSL